VRPEGLGKLKYFTSSGLEPPTFRLVAWRRNYYATACPANPIEKPLFLCCLLYLRPCLLVEPIIVIVIIIAVIVIFKYRGIITFASEGGTQSEGVREQGA
jgi:hypothetical protein